MKIQRKMLFLVAALLAPVVLLSGSTSAEDPAPNPVMVESNSADLVLASEASVYVPFPSFRWYDSRWEDAEGKWTVGDWRDSIADSDFPLEWTAVTFNVAAVATEGRGYVQIAGDGTDPYSTSTVNWTQPGQNIANSGTVILSEFWDDPDVDPIKWIGVLVGGPPGAAAHIIIDITGAYVPLTEVDVPGG